MSMIEHGLQQVEYLSDLSIYRSVAVIQMDAYNAAIASSTFAQVCGKSMAVIQ